ncbi:hypothetical protein CGLO_00127 [Colletotrichum gloeosporioides Cg-14]|uniref:Uncharacterized protein n=1 Tax=Colletotrichum gloeosporioides (strain Cg-14) TaxID=1237896 RepID=T0KVD1_COLGC|nr:hypothetical protein CGLO_00127 [Colletotrichum gloeosporioides Cg-14]
MPAIIVLKLLERRFPRR